MGCRVSFRTGSRESGVLGVTDGCWAWVVKGCGDCVEGDAIGGQKPVCVGGGRGTHTVLIP